MGLQYYKPVMCNGVVGSVDMVRIELKFNHDSFTDVSKVLDTVTCDEYHYYATRGGIGSYKSLWTFGFNDSSVAIGVGLFSKSGTPNFDKGFIEFNPNKLAHDMRFQNLYKEIVSYCKDLRLLRWDAAFDYSVARSGVTLMRDRRMYECTCSRTTTEYLGRRNQPGRVKVYDKRDEADLDTDLTRVELTCSGDWSLEEMQKHWPRVLGVDAAAQALVPLNRRFVSALAKLMELGEPVEPFLNDLDKRTKKKIKDALATTNEGTPFPFDIFAQLLINLNEWTCLL